jgi:hypothetical protein
MKIEMEIPEAMKKKKYFGIVGQFGQHFLYRLRYIDKALGIQVHTALLSQGYISKIAENDKAITLEIIAPIGSNISLILKKEKLSRNIERDTLILKEIQDLL